jgi:hypothetical protein
LVRNFLIRNRSCTSVYTERRRKLKYSREQEEIIAAMADEWSENFKVEMFESQAERLVRENNMPRLTNDQHQIGLSFFK